MREIITNIIGAVKNHQDNIIRLERGIEDITENIFRERENISKIEKGMFTMLGLEQGEVVKFVQYEHFEYNHAYSVYFEQEVELRSLSIYQDALRIGISKVGRKSVRFFSKHHSYSLFKMDGTPIVVNELNHKVSPYKVSENDKKRYLELQKI